MIRSCILATTFVTCISTVALGATTIGSTAVGPNPSSGHPYVGNTFIAPAEQGLISGSIVLHNDSGATATGQLQVYGFSHNSATGTFGPPVASKPFSIPFNANPNTPVIVSSTFNAALTPGNEYILLARWDNTPPSPFGSFFSNSYYADGVAVFGAADGTATIQTPYDLSFQATFGNIPEPASLCLVLGGMICIRRKR